jgi:hypothetical protein
MQLISADHYAHFLDAVAEMHRLRYRVFKERLDWDVQFSGDMTPFRLHIWSSEHATTLRKAAYACSPRPARSCRFCLLQGIFDPCGPIEPGLPELVMNRRPEPHDHTPRRSEAEPR